MSSAGSLLRWQRPHASVQCRLCERQDCRPSPSSSSGWQGPHGRHRGPQSSVNQYVTAWLPRSCRQQHSSRVWPLASGAGWHMQAYLNGRGDQDGAGRLQGDRAWEEALAVHAVGEQHRVPPEFTAQDVLHCRRDGCQGRGQVHDPVEELVLLLVVVLHLQATGTVSIPQGPEPNQMWYMQHMGRMRAISKLTPDIVCSPGVCFTVCS